MKLLTTFVVLVAAATVASWSVFAQPQGKGHGHGGRMPDDFRNTIHALFSDHEKVDRDVELTKTGYRATTTSDDPKVAKLLQSHVAQMQQRLDAGMGVRQWDPAFAELREHYRDLEMKIENVQGGVSVAVVGKTPEAIEVAKNHAKIVSGFVKKGDSQMHATHSAVANVAGSASEKSSTAAASGCEDCQKGKGGKGKGEKCGKCGDASCGKGGKPCCADR